MDTRTAKGSSGRTTTSTRLLRKPVTEIVLGTAADERTSKVPVTPAPVVPVVTLMLTRAVLPATTSRNQNSSGPDRASGPPNSAHSRRSFSPQRDQLRPHALR